MNEKLMQRERFICPICKEQIKEARHPETVGGIPIEGDVVYYYCTVGCKETKITGMAMHATDGKIKEMEFERLGWRKKL